MCVYNNILHSSTLIQELIQVLIPLMDSKLIVKLRLCTYKEATYIHGDSKEIDALH